MLPHQKLKGKGIKRDPSLWTELSGCSSHKGWGWDGQLRQREAASAGWRHQADRAWGQRCMKEVEVSPRCQREGHLLKGRGKGRKLLHSHGGTEESIWRTKLQRSRCYFSRTIGLIFPINPQNGSNFADIQQIVIFSCVQPPHLLVGGRGIE